MYIQRRKSSSYVLFPYWEVAGGKFQEVSEQEVFHGGRMGWETVYYIALTDLHRMQCWKYSYNTLCPLEVFQRGWEVFLGSFIMI